MWAAALVTEPEFQDAAQGEAVNGALAGRRSRVPPLQQALNQVLQHRVLAATKDYSGLPGGDLVGQVKAVDKVTRVSVIFVGE